jgi:hypothetical protein
MRYGQRIFSRPSVSMLANWRFYLVGRHVSRFRSPATGGTGTPLDSQTREPKRFMPISTCLKLRFLK